MAWTDFGISGRDAIVNYAVAFLDRYVKGTPETLTLLDAQPGVSTFLHN